MTKRAVLLAIFIAIAGGGVFALGAPGEQAQIGSLELGGDGNFLCFIDGGEPGRRHAEERSPIPGMEDMAGMEVMAGMVGMAGMPVGNPHGLFLFPSDAATGPDGTLYVSNTHAYEVLVFEPDGELRGAWGTKGPAAGEWEIPVGVATDAAGNVYVADFVGSRIQRFRVFLR